MDGVHQSSLLQPYIYDIICGSEDGIYPLFWSFDTGIDH